MSITPKPCKWCGQVNPKHWPFQCRKNPRITTNRNAKKPISKKAAADKRTRVAWYGANPPDENGYYWCYLNISSQCPRYMTPMETTLDHIAPKGTNFKLRHDLLNLMPSCYWCNSLKGSRSLKEAFKLDQNKPPLT